MSNRNNNQRERTHSFAQDQDQTAKTGQHIEEQFEEHENAVSVNLQSLSSNIASSNQSTTKEPIKRTDNQIGTLSGNSSANPNSQNWSSVDAPAQEMSSGDLDLDLSYLKKLEGGVNPEGYASTKTDTQADTTTEQEELDNFINENVSEEIDSEIDSPQSEAKGNGGSDNFEQDYNELNQLDNNLEEQQNDDEEIQEATDKAEGHDEVASSDDNGDDNNPNTPKPSVDEQFLSDLSVDAVDESVELKDGEEYSQERKNQVEQFKNQGKAHGLFIGQSLGFGTILLTDETGRITPKPFTESTDLAEIEAAKQAFNTEQDSLAKDIEAGTKDLPTDLLYFGEEVDPSAVKRPEYYESFTQGFNEGTLMGQELKAKKEAQEKAAAEAAKLDEPAYQEGEKVGYETGLQAGNGNYSEEINRINSFAEENKNPEGKELGALYGEAFIKNYNAGYKEAQDQRRSAVNDDEDFVQGLNLGFLIGYTLYAVTDADTAFSNLDAEDCPDVIKALVEVNIRSAQAIQAKNEELTNLDPESINDEEERKKKQKLQNGFIQGYNAGYSKYQNELRQGLTADQRKKREDVYYMTGLTAGNLKGKLSYFFAPNQVNEAVNNPSLLKDKNIEISIPENLKRPIIEEKPSGLERPSSSDEAREKEDYFDEAFLLGYNSGYEQAVNLQQNAHMAALRKNPDFIQATKVVSTIKIDNDKYELNIGQLAAHVTFKIKELQRIPAEQQSSTIKERIEVMQKQLDTINAEVLNQSDIYQTAFNNSFNNQYSLEVKRSNEQQQKRRELQRIGVKDSEKRLGYELGAKVAQKIFDKKKELGRLRNKGENTQKAEVMLQQKSDEAQKKANEKGAEFGEGYLQGFNDKMYSLVNNKNKKQGNQNVGVSVEEYAKKMQKDPTLKGLDEASRNKAIKAIKKQFQEGAEFGYNDAYQFLKKKSVGPDELPQLDSSILHERIQSKLPEKFDQLNNLGIVKENESVKDLIVRAFKLGFYGNNEQSLSDQSINIKSNFGIGKGFRDGWFFLAGKNKIVPEKDQKYLFKFNTNDYHYLQGVESSASIQNTQQLEQKLQNAGIIEEDTSNVEELKTYEYKNVQEQVEQLIIDWQSIYVLSSGESPEMLEGLELYSSITLYYMEQGAEYSSYMHIHDQRSAAEAIEQKDMLMHGAMELLSEEIANQEKESIIDTLEKGLGRPLDLNINEDAQLFYKRLNTTRDPIIDEFKKGYRFAIKKGEELLGKEHFLDWLRYQGLKQGFEENVDKTKKNRPQLPSGKNDKHFEINKDHQVFKEGYREGSKMASRFNSGLFTQDQLFKSKTLVNSGVEIPAVQGKAKAEKAANSDVAKRNQEHYSVALEEIKEYSTEKIFKQEYWLCYGRVLAKDMQEKGENSFLIPQPELAKGSYLQQFKLGFISQRNRVVKAKEKELNLFEQLAKSIAIDNANFQAASDLQIKARVQDIRDKEAPITNKVAAQGESVDREGSNTIGQGEELANAESPTQAQKIRAAIVDTSFIKGFADELINIKDSRLIQELIEEQYKEAGEETAIPKDVLTSFNSFYEKQYNVAYFNAMSFYSNDFLFLQEKEQLTQSQNMELAAMGAASGDYTALNNAAMALNQLISSFSMNAFPLIESINQVALNLEDERKRFYNFYTEIEEYREYEAYMLKEYESLTGKKYAKEEEEESSWWDDFLWWEEEEDDFLSEYESAAGYDYLYDSENSVTDDTAVQELENEILDVQFIIADIQDKQDAAPSNMLFEVTEKLGLNNPEYSFAEPEDFLNYEVDYIEFTGKMDYSQSKGKAESFVNNAYTDIGFDFYSSTPQIYSASKEMEFNYHQGINIKAEGIDIYNDQISLFMPKIVIPRIEGGLNVGDYYELNNSLEIALEADLTLELPNAVELAGGVSKGTKDLK